MSRAVKNASMPPVPVYCQDYAQEQVGNATMPNKDEYCHDRVLECELDKEEYDGPSNFTFCDECHDPEEGKFATRQHSSAIFTMV